MKLMAKSCAGCPGFSTLITNLFYQPLKDLDLLLNEVAANDPMSEEAVNMRLYLRGARYQLYRLEFPECFYGTHSKDVKAAKKRTFVPSFTRSPFFSAVSVTGCSVRSLLSWRVLRH